MPSLVLESVTGVESLSTGPMNALKVNMVDYGDDEGVMIEEASDSDFAKEQGDPISCVVQRLLCNQKKAPDTT